jgi:NAD(P)-dependent dehydrogenase (short-subunit alcohol dehydrogenase family)
MDNIFSLRNKTILITGASSGIGRQIAITASAMGATLIITGRDEERLLETKNLLAGESTHLVADLTRHTEVNALIAGLPRLDGVVFCAGVVEYTPVKFISAEKIDKIFLINFNSQVLLTQQLLKGKKMERAASLVYISSISAKIGVAATALYAASKAALNSFVKVTASELASQKIRANAICPGLVRTPLLSRAAGDNLSAETFSEAEKSYLLGLGETQDVAGPAVFLLSDAARWITGTEIIVDGGLTVN